MGAYAKAADQEIDTAKGAFSGGRPLRVLLVSKALVVGAYQRKAEEIAALGVDLTVVTPELWADSRGAQRLERVHTQGYHLQTLPLRLGGNFHLHSYVGLDRLLANLRPDLLHMDEEPYNAATWAALRSAHAQGIPATFFTWQNLLRSYPPPFRQMELATYARAPLALAGSEEAAAVLRAKGYRGEVAVIPQFGVDEELFAPVAPTAPHGALHSALHSALRIGYAGGLLPEKGVDLLLRAAARLPAPWRLAIAGEGAERAALERLAGALGVADRVHFVGRIGSSDMPAFHRHLDVLVLPSRTRPNWKEQFGRVLIEAMACGVVVVGSRCGEIPTVIGDAGLTFPEEDVDALVDLLTLVQSQPDLRAALGAAGRARVLERYTMRRVAQQSVAAYARLLALSGAAEARP
jgi:glycosyltransferase involved in cell wall biosynthesis